MESLQHGRVHRPAVIGALLIALIGTCGAAAAADAYFVQRRNFMPERPGAPVPAKPPGQPAVRSGPVDEVTRTDAAGKAVRILFATESMVPALSVSADGTRASSSTSSRARSRYREPRCPTHAAPAS